MIKKTENCLYCGVKMESKTAKKKFCSPLHRVYWNRAQKLKKELQTEKEARDNPLIGAARGRDANGINNDEVEPTTWIDKVQAAADANKHSLWKEGDPKEGSMAFYMKYECYTYDELLNKKNEK